MTIGLYITNMEVVMILLTLLVAGHSPKWNVGYYRHCQLSVPQASTLSGVCGLQNKIFFHRESHQTVHWLVLPTLTA